MEFMVANREQKTATIQESVLTQKELDARKQQLVEQKKIQKLKDLVKKNKAKNSYEMHLEQQRVEIGSAYALRQNVDQEQLKSYNNRIKRLEAKEL